MFEATDTDIAPWIVVRSNDKKRARINAMRYVLAKSDYDDKDDGVMGEVGGVVEKEGGVGVALAVTAVPA